MKLLSYNNWIKEVTSNAFKNAKYLNLTEGKVHYTDVGNPKGIPIIHFHGSPAGADVGLYFFDEFIKEGFRIITMSRPGFLGTDITLGKTIDEQADLYKTFIDGLKLKKIIIHAWSAGGPPAIKFAEKYPNNIKGMILFCALSVKWNHKITFFEKLVLSSFGMYALYVASRIFVSSIRKKCAIELGADYGYIKKDNNRLELLDKFLQLTAPPKLRNPGSFNDIENYSKMRPFDFKSIKTETLILFSPSDNQLEIKNGDVPANEMLNCKYVKFKHGGHMPQLGKEWKFLFDEILNFTKTASFKINKHEGF